MSDENVQFEEDISGSEFHLRSQVLQVASSPRSVRYLISNGVVKTEGQAIWLMLSVVTLFLLLSGWIASASLQHPANLHVTDKFGREIPFEVYAENIRNGDDPLNYK